MVFTSKIERALDYKTIWERVEPIEGWLTKPEALALAQIAARVAITTPQAAIVEVGSWLGRSTIAIAAAVSQVSAATRIHAIDPHTGDLGWPFDRVAGPTWDKFRENLRSAGVEEHVIPYRSCAVDVKWESPIGMLFLDAEHDWTSVRRDFSHFSSWFIPGGYACVHDYDGPWSGVTTFVDELAESKEWTLIDRAGSLAVLCRS